MSRPVPTRIADWLGIDQALARILGGVRPLPSEPSPPHGALGRVVAADVRARAALPAHDNSAMDGYAVRSADVAAASPETPVRLPVAARIVAGSRPSVPIAPGTAVAVTTGAPIPAGADTVIRIEDTDREAGAPGTVAILSTRDLGRHVRPAGQDLRAGDVAVAAGTRIGPGVLAVLLACGHATVPLTRRPRVAVVATGDELAPLEDFDAVVRGERVPETNGPMLAALVDAAGGEPHLLPIAPDEHEALRACLHEALGAGDPTAAPDLVVTIGGASMGERDLVKDVLDGFGMELDFWRVRMRPGSPVGFGRLPREGDPARPIPVLSLPGNPGSAFVTGHLFVRPLVLALAGASAPHLPVIDATAGHAIPSVEGLCHFVQVTLDVRDHAAVVATPVGALGSGLVSGLGRATALAVVPEGTAGVAKGDRVLCLLLDPGLQGRADPGYRSHVDGPRT